MPLTVASTAAALLIATVTLAPSSLVPVSVNPCSSSVALIKLSAETSTTLGAEGASRSTVTVDETTELVFPASSVCVTETVF